MQAMIPMGAPSTRMGTVIAERMPWAANQVRFRTRVSCMTSVTTSGSWVSKTRPASPSPTLSVCRDSTRSPVVPVSARRVSTPARTSRSQMRTTSTPSRVWATSARRSRTSPRSSVDATSQLDSAKTSSSRVRESWDGPLGPVIGSWLSFG
jgi:hypothetical protein